MQHLWNAETVGRFRFLLRMNRIVSALLAAGRRRSIGDLNGDKESAVRCVILDAKSAFLPRNGQRENGHRAAARIPK